MQRSSEESPGQAGVTALTGEDEVLVLPEPDHPLELERSNSSDEPPQTSTLIEFPGVSKRSEPPWRKELSRRVREVQERRAREPVAAPDRRPPARDPVLSQLELVPELPTPAMNQLVENALRRVERARRADVVVPQRSSPSQSGLVSRHGAATAVARAKVKAPDPDASNASPAAESMQPEAPTKSAKRSLTRRKLEIVPPPEAKENKSIAKPVRLIKDGVDDSALSYLDNHFPEAHAGLPIGRAGLGRRVVSGLFDSVFVAILAAPFASGIELADGSWTDPRIILLMVGAASVVMIVYQTFSTALRGQTWGMRLLSLHTVDARTGLIPTGSQSIRRALSYVFSMATLGLGFLYVLVDSEHLAPHDRFSGTFVVRK
jgi:uncharacterized RDD family membrane protein YckC